MIKVLGISGLVVATALTLSAGSAPAQAAEPAASTFDWAYATETGDWGAYDGSLAGYVNKPSVDEEPPAFPVYIQKGAPLRTYQEQVVFMANLHNQQVAECKRIIENEAYRGNQAGWNAYCERLPAAVVEYFEIYVPATGETRR